MSKRNLSKIRKEANDLLLSIPENVTLKILECLPLQDAVRTSVSSTRWKDKWTELPQIIIDKQFFSTVVEGRVARSEITATYSNIVNSILLSHVGTLSKFVLYIPFSFGYGSIFCKWMQFVSRKNVSELDLYDPSDVIRFLSTLSCFAGLTSLRLCRCTIPTLPPTFAGFSCLVSLALVSYYCCSADKIVRFIASCPQLRRLHLDWHGIIFGSRYLTIQAPKLEFLYVKGSSIHLCLGNETTELRTLHLDFECLSFFWRAINSRSLLQCLRLGPPSFNPSFDGHRHFGDEILTDDFGRLEIQTLELKGVPRYCPFVSCFVLYLLTRSRPLQRLYCRVAEDDFCKCDIPVEMPDCSLSNFRKGNLASLKYAELVCISGSSNELQFIKRILECAPMLKEMTIKLSKNVKEADNKLKIAMELMQFSRASTNARIVFKAFHN